MAKEIFDRMPNLASPISGPSLEGIRKEKVRSSTILSVHYPETELFAR
ncbi:hypothetical protein QT990_25450 [Microcoleus sp. T3_B1]